MKESRPPQQVYLGLFFFSHLYNMPIKQPPGIFLICDLLLHLQRIGSRPEQLQGTSNNNFPQ